VSGQDWTRTWASPDGRLVVEWATSDGVLRHRFRSDAEGDGAVVVAVRDGRTLFVEIDRPVVGVRLLELPRGQAEREDADPGVTALRELLEETGYVGSSARDVGIIWPDSGLCADAVHVVLVSDPVRSDASPEFLSQHWMTDEEVSEAVRSGRVRDGVSLAALSLVGRDPARTTR
jgi:8-oxo-dGTP pyrophosphatase MutT (NUDIX family)